MLPLWERQGNSQIRIRVYILSPVIILADPVGRQKTFQIQPSVCSKQDIAAKPISMQMTAHLCFILRDTISSWILVGIIT